MTCISRPHAALTQCAHQFPPPIIFLTFREGGMSFQAKIAGHWPTLFYYLYETKYSNRRRERERLGEKDGNSNTLTKGQGDAVDCDRSGGTLFGLVIIPEEK
ncbi:hypothetical protein DAPPUDRAFT_308552 [Daphnia pulex]|uniref:Uncharacterized protein n=1 Tax=Daphnia pulex TaxID=6669 RepID=E9H810_DAPPU|nr:hypothetical protein DAPPUDRAFT_308552 [Daphnia pulex]|eukprot:EFX72126.1 hypothetical protein DAPPUDRAFT_308552 [Daphnia pulex]